MPPKRLDLWMNGEFVGRWYNNRFGTSVLEYSTEWINSPKGRPLSLSLPFLPKNQAHKGPHVNDWFENLLPDSTPIRERLARRFRTGSAQSYDLLAAIGRDCVGAVQLLPPDEIPQGVGHLEAELLTDEQVTKHLRGVTTGGDFGFDQDSDEFRISIAGAQEKTALLRIGEAWAIPRGTTPTTHILKLPLGMVGHMRADMQDSVENEWLCMQFLSELGIPVAATEIGKFEDELGSQKALIVTRFDRDPALPREGDTILRLPQEDFCQATGTPAIRKYESDGGPGIREALGLLSGAERSKDDSLTFAKAQLAFWLLAAPDGHAKNFSIFLKRAGYSLTPLYDVVSAWPVIGHGPNQWPVQKARLAMALRGENPHRELNKITVRHWKLLSDQTGHPRAFEEMVDLVRNSAAAFSRIEARIPADFPQVLWTAIERGVAAQRERFELGLKLHPELSN